MANTNNTTAHPLSTQAGRDAHWKATKKVLVREDFPATPEGWMWFCEHKIAKHTREVVKNQELVDQYTKLKGGEHLKDVLTAVSELESLTKQLEAKKQELAALNAAKK